MDRNSYLNPDSIYAQCEQAVKYLINDNYQIEGIKKSLNAFIEDDALQGEAYSALKMQISDYLLILDTKVLANQADRADFITLAYSVGDEELDGNKIVGMMEQALADKETDDVKAGEYEVRANAASWFGEEWYYRAKASHYRNLAENDRKRYEEWKAKADAYDNIENSTKNLFTESQCYREKVENAINGITKVFDGGEYQINEKASWRVALYDTSQKKKWEEGVQDALLEYGYTQEEIDDLIAHGVVMTAEDIKKLKQTEGNTSIYVSDDHKALLYNGKIYYINEPDTVSDGSGYDLPWRVDDTVEKTKTDFDLLAAVTGISGEDIPTEDVFDSDRAYMLQSKTDAYGTVNMQIAGAMHAFLLLESVVLSGASHTEITMYFESAENSRRVTIWVGSSTDRQKFQNINYALPVNTYRSQDSYTQQMQASAQAAQVYTILTGIDADRGSTYTLVGTLDERHKDCGYSGYLSYSDKGTLQCTPIIFSGDTASVATCDAVSGRNTHILCDFTDKLTQPTAVDPTTQKLFEKMLSGN